MIRYDHIGFLINSLMRQLQLTIAQNVINVFNVLIVEAYVIYQDENTAKNQIINFEKLKKAVLANQIILQ